MKLLHLFLAGIAVCAFNACEKQPYSKIESITQAEHKDGHASEGKAAEKPQKGESVD